MESYQGVPFKDALRFWIQLGFISFGGSAGQIAIMHREVVERRKWLSDERFFHALNFCMLLPGPEATQLATYIGWLMHGVRGGLAAGGFFVLPSVFVLAGLSYIYIAYGHVAAVAGVLAGLKPVVVAIVAEALWKIGRRALKHAAHVVIAIVTFLALAIGGVPFPLLVLMAGILGWMGTRLMPEAFPAPVLTETERNQSHPPMLRTVKVLVVGLAFWAIPFAALILWRGAGSFHAQQYRFFSQAAMVTFGGAYAVLAYITQAVTAAGGWLTRAQAIDGLALAESTPGPLIMVLQFIGFVAAWARPEGMTPLAAALLGAAITTYTTFLPSYIFIFAGAPYVEALRGNRALAGALAAITAAVVGVILNLALVFGSAVLWQGGTIRWEALALAVAALWALVRWHVNVLWVVVFGGAAGLLLAQMSQG